MWCSPESAAHWRRRPSCPRKGAYPNKPVRYINPFPAGGATDTLSRLFCAKMQELTGQQWIVENKGGSGGNVGVDALAQSPADGYTLGLGGIASHAIAPTLYAKLPFKVPDDFTFVSTIWQLPNMLVVNLDLPAKNVAELIELLKKNPGKYSYASAGNGTTLHLSGELFKVMAKVDMLHVPYRGAAPAMQDLLAGQVSMIFDNIPGALAQYRVDKVRALGVTSKERTPVVPDVPAIAETLPGFDINSWTTLTGPAKLPPTSWRACRSCRRRRWRARTSRRSSSTSRRRRSGARPPTRSPSATPRKRGSHRSSRRRAHGSTKLLIHLPRHTGEAGRGKATVVLPTISDHDLHTS